MRIKSRWHNKSKQKSVEEIAGAMGFNIWKMASTTANKMYSTGFNFSSNEQLLEVIGEYVMFLIQVSDRLVYEELSADERQRFVSALALHLVRTMADNMVEEMGPGDYAQPFIDRLNERLDTYSEFSFTDGPSYPMLRYLGEQIEKIMGGGQNKWVTEQVMEVEAPELVKTLKRGLESLIGTREQAEGEAAGDDAAGPV